MSLVWRILNAFMGALFLFAASLQFNDDDPVCWGAIYAAAALPCVLVVVRRSNLVLPAAIAGIGIVWAAVYAVRGAWSVPFSEMFAEWEMKNEAVRQAREMFGLMIVATWMVALLLAGRFAKRRSRPPPPA